MGRLALEDAPGAGEGAAGRPRSLALLAILAAAGETGVPRDRLLLYLWPESNTQRARNSLHQTLYALRQHLGQESVLVSASSLRLNPRRFTCDLWDFESACSRGAHEEAIANYGGAFLAGFSLAELPEFERWIEEQRGRLARRYAEALEASAEEAQNAGAHSRAVERWRALTALDPLSARYASSLTRALAAAGDPAGALDHARSYDALVRRQLGIAPDPAVTALIAELQARGSLGDGLALRTLPEPAIARSRWSTRTRLLAVSLIAETLILIGILARPMLRERSHARENLVAVFPFTVSGSPGLEYLETGLVDVLTTNLDGAGTLRAVDPQALLARLSRREDSIRSPEEAERVAAHFGARRFLMGSVVESNGRVQVRAALYDREAGRTPEATASVQGDTADIFGMVDRLTTQLLAESGGPADRLARVAATTTRSVDALKSYLAGEKALREGASVPAMDAYVRAVAADTGFALAYYRLSIAAEWLGRDSLSRAAAATAARLADRLTEHDRRLVEALAARHEGRSADAERLYREVVNEYPDDVEAWFQLGQLLFQVNPLRGRSVTEARPAFERVLALDPENEEALVHLARIAFIEGRHREVDTLVARVLAIAPDREVLALRAFRAFALGDREAHKRVTREMVDSPPDLPPVSALQVAVYLDDVEGVHRFARLLRDERYSDDVRGLGYRLLARVAAARGRWGEARTLTDSAGRFDPVSALELRSLLAAMPFLPVPEADRRAVRGEVERWGPDDGTGASHSEAHTGLHRFLRLYRLGMLDAALGDVVAARACAERLEQSADSLAAPEAEALRAFALSIRARLELDAGRADTALALLDRANWELVEPAFESEALHRYYRAELLRTLGRDAEAAAWYRTIAERATYELVYVAPAQARLAEIYRRTGDHRRAADARARALRLWKDADAPLHSPR